MSDLPDELWAKILGLGIKNSKFTCKDLCSMSLSCKRLYRLSGEDSFWSHLLFSDFPAPMSPIHYSVPSSSSASPKFQYKIRFKRQRDSEKLLAALGRALLELDRQVAENLSRLRERAAQMSVLEPERQFSLYVSQRSEIEAERRAKLQKDNLIAKITAKIREIELAQGNKKRKPTVAEYFNLPKANSNGFECVPNRRYSRERRKGFTRQRKTWYQ